MPMTQAEQRAWWVLPAVMPLTFPDPEPHLLAALPEQVKVECVCGAVIFHRCGPEPHSLAALYEEEKVECVKQIQELADFLRTHFRENMRLLGKKRTVETACALLENYKDSLTKTGELPVHAVRTYY